MTEEKLDIEIRLYEYSSKYPQMAIEKRSLILCEQLFADFLIKKGGKPIAAIVIKKHPNSSDIDDAKRVISESFNQNDICYVIIVRNEKHCLVATPNKSDGRVLVYPTTIKDAFEFLSYEFSKIDKADIEQMTQVKRGQSMEIKKSKISKFRS